MSELYNISLKDSNDTVIIYLYLLPLPLRVVATVIGLVVVVVGLVGNCLVVMVIYWNRDMRSSINFFLAHLSVVDIMVLLVCAPSGIAELHAPQNVWVFGYILCKAVPFIELWMAHSSALTIVAISFERYIVICEPLKSKYQLSRKRAMLICALACLVACLASGPILHITQLTTIEAEDGSVNEVCEIPAVTTWQRSFFILLMVFFFLIPLIIQIIVYYAVVRVLIIDNQPLGRKAKARNKHRKQIVVMTVCVVIVFFLCLLPFRVFSLWNMFASNEDVQSLNYNTYMAVLYGCRMLVYLNSAVNPIVYNIVSSKFRRGCFRLLKLAIREPPHPPGSVAISGQSPSRSYRSTTSTSGCYQSSGRKSVVSFKEKHPAYRRRKKSNLYEQHIGRSHEANAFHDPRWNYNGNTSVPEKESENKQNIVDLDKKPSDGAMKHKEMATLQYYEMSEEVAV